MSVVPLSLRNAEIRKNRAACYADLMNYTQSDQFGTAAVERAMGEILFPGHEIEHLGHLRHPGRDLLVEGVGHIEVKHDKGLKNGGKDISTNVFIEKCQVSLDGSWTPSGVCVALNVGTVGYAMFHAALGLVLLFDTKKLHDHVRVRKPTFAKRSGNMGWILRIWDFQTNTIRPEIRDLCHKIIRLNSAGCAEYIKI